MKHAKAEGTRLPVSIRTAVLLATVIGAIGLAEGAGAARHIATAAPDSSAVGAPSAPQAHGPVEVPLRVAGGHLLVPVDIGQAEPMDFILSNGSGLLVLSETAAAHLGDAPELSLGGLPIPTEGFVTAADDRFQVDGKTVGGLIAGNMLNQFDVLVDAPGGRLVLKPIGREVAWEGVTLSDPMPMRVYHGIALSFEVEVDGEQYPATLDLGASSLVANAGLQGKVGLEDEDAVTLTIGGTTFADMPIRVRDLEIFARWDPEGAGFVLVGAPVAYDCAISISYVHQELRTCVR